MSALASAITVSVSEVMTRAVQALGRRDCVDSAARGITPYDTKMTAMVRKLSYENDALQQYSRRESIRIFGVSQASDESSETTERKALSLLRETGVSVNESYVSACHRVGRPRNGSRAIIVKFVSRRKRTEVMRRKK